MDVYIVNDPLIGDFRLIFQPPAINLSVDARSRGSSLAM
jgi:hypothetical protein